MTLVSENTSRGGAPTPDAPLTRSRVIAFGIIVTVIGAVTAGAALFGDPAPPERVRRTPDAPAVRGTACPLLARAAEMFSRGDPVAFSDAVKDASRDAIRTLDRSGEVFGPAERTAVQLRYDVQSGDTERIKASLEKAEKACSAEGRWPTG
jgi:hypothetical protein